MVMRFDLQIRVSKDLSKYKPGEVDFLKSIAPLVADMIWDRTGKGELPDGEKMAPLRDYYAKAKMKRGRRGIRDFRDSGDLESSMYASITKSGGLRFGSTGRAATGMKYQKMADMLARRGRMSGNAPYTFVALSDKEIKVLRQKLADHLARQLDKVPKKYLF